MIICENLAFSYEGVNVLSDVSFEIKSGEYICIVGENGSGKSTLVKGILGLKNPSSGRIIYDGISKKDIGYLPQYSQSKCDFPSSVYEVVLSGRLNSMRGRAFFNKEDKAEAQKAMQLMDILRIKRQNFSELSGGQKQRVLLARALCSAKKLIVLDEPASGLDPKVSYDMYSLVKRINSELGITILMVSHDIRSAIEFSSHILHLNKTQTFYGEKEAYVESEIGKNYLCIWGCEHHVH
ncbi:MAG: ABC transporter ATP-binding protein [Clostridiales bacterium]|jgi:zinc transport system ATP-binding protein|nr:ABC transporter ATP-binding protein [Clostridiales bacterium]